MRGSVAISDAVELPKDFEDGTKAPPRQRREFSIPPWISIFILGAGLLVFYLLTLNFYALPTALLLTDEADNPDSFIAERARNMLIEFDKIGPKVVGSSQNEEQAIAFLRATFDDIFASKNEAHDLIYSHTIHSGSFFKGIEPHGSVRSYQNIQNVQMRLSPATGTPSGATILINSHFDTVPTSPGASDAGTMVVIMLEMLRVLSQSTTPFRHDIVFLFNGAEEVGLMGSHAFITQHRWRHNITGLINLDSIGSGGKEILFHAGPDAPWLSRFYARNIKYPYASCMGEELFQMNLIPSDTDFRIFRDFGGIKGFDLAYSYNGYVYHTKHDALDIIPLGTFQHTGTNALSLARAMANSDEFDIGVEHNDDESIFFDYLSWFTITYTKLAAIIVNICVGLYMLKAAIPSVRSMCVECDYPVIVGIRDFVYMFLLQAGSAILGLGLALVLCVIFDAAGRSLSFYSNPWLVFGIYWLPFIFGLCIGPMIYFRVDRNTQLDQHYQLQMWTHAHAILLTLILFLLTFFGIRSAFVILIPVVFYGLTMTINLMTGYQNKPHLWIPIMALGQLFPFFFFCHLSMIGLTTFIPMAAMGGPGMNPDLIVCAFSFLMAFLMTGFITPFIGFMRRDLWVWGGVAVLIVASFIMIATPLGFPYRAEVSPQRHIVFHSQRNLHNLNGGVTVSENGYFIIPTDRHSGLGYLIDDVPALEMASPLGYRCDQTIFCGVPFYSTGMLRLSQYSYWIPAEEPIFNEPVELIRIEANQPENRLMFQLSGPDARGVVIAPMPGIEIERWSFASNVTDLGLNWQGRLTYVVMHSAGLNAPSTFWIDITVPTGWIGKRVDIGVVAHYTHFDDQQTPNFRNFIASYPDWAHVAAWISSYNGYEF